MSPLNPYAAPFIPFSRQRADNENVVPITSENSKIDDATAQYKQVKVDEAKAIKRTSGDFKTSYENPLHQLPTNSYIEGPPVSGELLGKDYNIHSFQDPRSHKTRYGTEKRSSFEEQELDLAYLTAEFPGMSEQSLVDVYCANAGDLEASVDMLIQLEDDEVLRLPDTLDLLDISVSGTPGDSSRMQKTTDRGEASGSSSSRPFAS
ncbi:hypothetical protein MRB53_017296 [Persea americana]|uniref:Uncharacterized protein n=1 Tax=Persea americana TaxID=3435 RepID=A0ACC2M495_PERAE|nr:hypothetical protein MRB53_017296 [Persea americana]